MKFDKAQTLAEYGLLVVIIVAAIYGMQVYVKRGLQARYKTIVDGAGGPAGIKQIKQYEPYYAQSEQIIDRKNQTTYTQEPKGVQTRGINDAITVSAKDTTGLDIGADDDWK